MNKIKFVSSWLDFNESTWSGVPHGLYTALQKKMNVEFLNVSPPKRGKGIIETVKYLISIYTAGIPTLNFGIKQLNKSYIKGEGIPYLVFAEYSCKQVKNLYVFQDMSIDFLLRNEKLDCGNHPIFSRIIKRNYIKKNKKAIKFYKNCAGIFTMSEWLRNDFITQTKINSNKVYVVGGGYNVDPSKIDYSQKEGNRFIFVGKEWEIKNGDLVVKAFEILQKTNPNIHLYIIGPNECPKIAINKKNVHYLGRLPASELYKYYNLCDYFVMPSKFDAYGLVFAEALTFGLPCIGKNIFAMPEFIKNGENGFLIENNDEYELSQKMQQLLIEGKKMSLLLQKQRDENLRRYSWDSVAQRIIDVLRKDGYDV